MNKNSLLTMTDRGLYCKRGDFYIDPWKPVKNAVVTHIHADHAYRGNENYLVSKPSEGLARIRLDREAKIESEPYGKKRDVNGVKVSFHPAGHILGSAQVRVEYKDEVWIASGDYKLTPDPTCEPFEPVKCNFFITEATFGLPIYQWTPPKQVFAQIDEWWRADQAVGKASVIFAYSLGKAQRILNGVDRTIGKIFTHGSVERLTEEYRRQGIDVAPTTYAGSVTDKKEFAGSLIVGPPSSQSTPWLKRFGAHSTGFASGWMMVRGARRQRAVDRGFVLSDHADWAELNTAIRSTEADTVYVTHGFSDEVVRWLNETGMNAVPLKTQYLGDDGDQFSDEEGQKGA